MRGRTVCASTRERFDRACNSQINRRYLFCGSEWSALDELGAGHAYDAWWMGRSWRSCAPAGDCGARARDLPAIASARVTGIVGRHLISQLTSSLVRARAIVVLPHLPPSETSRQSKPETIVFDVCTILLTCNNYMCSVLECVRLFTADAQIHTQ